MCICVCWLESAKDQDRERSELLRVVGVEVDELEFNQRNKGDQPRLVKSFEPTERGSD